ncbi:uncharacterized protein LOC108740141 isoform X2 [Agrilus planipennis]|uniref:Uncharacterized protein LOC108740141 isoform X2 n=1 Tax=Agrilus planipennis TaxID=224129 RepID=A0A1W4XBZ0_AGRPL|nr:uncharacterized protein LOC108740141 isoform X2 [Agrilus planipennis]
MLYRFSVFLLIYVALAAELHHDKLELVYYDKSYIKNPIFSISELNGQYGFNISFDLLKDLGMHVKLNINISMQEENSKEYTSMQNFEDMDVCDMLKSDMFGIRKLMAVANITDCPWKAGHYKMLDLKGDPSGLPPVPSGNYMTD